MDLAIEVLRPDPWHAPALARLEARDPDGATAYRRRRLDMSDWEAQEAVEFAINVELVIRQWERMEPGRCGCPQLNGRDSESAALHRALHYETIFQRFRWARCVSPKGGAFVIAGHTRHDLNRIAVLLRSRPEPLTPLEALEEAVATRSVWWSF